MIIIIAKGPTIVDLFKYYLGVAFHPNYCIMCFVSSANGVTKKETHYMQTVITALEAQNNVDSVAIANALLNLSVHDLDVVADYSVDFNKQCAIVNSYAKLTTMQFCIALTLLIEQADVTELSELAYNIIEARADNYNFCFNNLQELNSSN